MPTDQKTIDQKAARAAAMIGTLVASTFEHAYQPGLTPEERQQWWEAAHAELGFKPMAGASGKMAKVAGRVILELVYDHPLLAFRFMDDLTSTPPADCVKAITTAAFQARQQVIDQYDQQGLDFAEIDEDEDEDEFEVIRSDNPQDQNPEYTSPIGDPTLTTAKPTMRILETEPEQDPNESAE